MTLQTFLTGTVNSASILEGDNTNEIRSHWFAGFVQDDYRVTPRLTFNLGLRYEYESPPTERNKFLGDFNPNVNPATTPAVEQVGPGAPIPSYYNPDYRISRRGWALRGTFVAMGRLWSAPESDF
jgi:outer membrane receptor protein involved in Fe transport